MSKSAADILADGKNTAVFLALSVIKLKLGTHNAVEWTIAALERADRFLDEISDFGVLVTFTIPQLEELSSQIDSMMRSTMAISMIASSSIDPNDPEAMEKLEKIQKLSMQVIEKAANAKAMIAMTILAKRFGREKELLEGKFGPLEPSPIVEQEIQDLAAKAHESGDYDKP